MGTGLVGKRERKVLCRSNVGRDKRYDRVDVRGARGVEGAEGGMRHGLVRDQRGVQRGERRKEEKK